MPMIDAPGSICGATTRVRASKARVFAVERPVPVLVLRLERRPDHSRRRVVDEHVERSQQRDLLQHAVRGDVPADQDRLRSERLELLRGLLGRRIGAHVADRDPGGAEPGEAERDRLADPARSPGHEDRGARERS